MNHSVALKKLCRICGKFLKGKTFKVNNYTDNFQKTFYVDFSKDEIGVHPELFCSKCYQHWKNINVRGTTLDRDVFVWVEHSGNCTVCERLHQLSKGGKSKKSDQRGGAKGRPTEEKARWTREVSQKLIQKSTG